jgi:hypothetical protein
MIMMMMMMMNGNFCSQVSVYLRIVWRVESSGGMWQLQQWNLLILHYRRNQIWLFLIRVNRGVIVYYSQCVSCRRCSAHFRILTCVLEVLKLLQLHCEPILGQLHTAVGCRTTRSPPGGGFATGGWSRYQATASSVARGCQKRWGEGSDITASQRTQRRSSHEGAEQRFTGIDYSRIITYLKRSIIG